MKSFFAVFTKAWFWWLVGLIATSALVWFGFPLIKFGDNAPLASAAIRLGVILVLVIIWSIINLRLQKNQKDTEEEQESKIDPVEIKQAIILLKSNFRKALNLVIQGGAWWKRWVQNTQYQVPWYLVIGAPQSGRSSLLRQSNLPYPIANESHQQISQEKEELCHWWFSKDGIFIDTHADLITNTEKDSIQHRVWTTLLILLKRYRRAKPIDGVILTIDINELLHKNTAERTTIAHGYRTQLQNINQMVGIQSLVYLCFTKLDLVAGFNEYTAQLTEEERQKLFGFSFDLDVKKDNVHQFDVRFTQFVERLSTHSLSYLNQTSDPKKSALIFNFITQLRSIQPIIRKFMLDVFESNRFQQRLALRGVYFTSALQQGTATDYIAASTNQQYGIDTVQIANNNIARRSYFIHDFFTQAVFSEKDVLLFNNIQKNRQKFAIRFAYFFAASVVAAMLYLWGNSFLLNHERLKLVRTDVAQFESISANTASVNSSLLYVLPMLNEIYDMRASFHPSDDPSEMRYGLYQGNKVDEVAEEIYLKNLMVYFMPYVLDLVRNELKNPDAKPNQIYNALRVYLMLGNPSKMEPDFVVSWLVGYWEQRYSSQPDTVASLELHAESIFSKSMKPITIDEQLVAQARAKLVSTTQAERDYFELQELAEVGDLTSLQISNGIDLAFNQVFGEAAARSSVPALYTGLGYHEIYEAEMQKIIENENYASWILGKAPEKSIKLKTNNHEITKQLETFYMRDYIKYWKQIIGNLHIQPFNNLKQAGNILGLIASPNSPMIQTLTLINENTVLNPAKAEAGNTSDLIASSQKHLKANQALVNAVQPKALTQASSKVKRFVPKYKKGKKGAAGSGSSANVDTPVDENFAPINQLLKQTGAEGAAPIDQIMDNITKLYDTVMEINTSPNPSEKAYQFVMATVETKAADNPLIALQTQSESLPEPVKEWVQSIVKYTWQSMLASASDYIAAQYQNQLFASYQSSIAAYYPFNANSEQSLNLTDFTTYFAPAGKIDAFFNQYLKMFVDTESSTWRLKPVLGSVLPINPQIVIEFERASKIRQAFFAEAAGPPKLTYSLIVVNMSPSLKSANLTLNKTILDYRHGPKRAISFTWPSDDVDNRDKMVLTDLSENQKPLTANGSWSAFKLINQGKIGTSKTDPNGVLVTYNLAGGEVTYLLNVTGSINPFSPKVLKYFQLPKKFGVNNA